MIEVNYNGKEEKFSSLETATEFAKENHGDVWDNDNLIASFYKNEFTGELVEDRF